MTDAVASISNEEEICAICCNAVKQPVQVPCCGNSFCQECMESWRTKDLHQHLSRKCPMCRHTLPPTELMKYYVTSMNKKCKDVRFILDSGVPLPLPPQTMDRKVWQQTNAHTTLLAFLVAGLPKTVMENILSLEHDQQQAAFRALLESQLEDLAKLKAPVEKAVEETKHFLIAENATQTVMELPLQVVKSLAIGDFHLILEWLYSGTTVVCAKRISALSSPPDGGAPLLALATTMRSRAKVSILGDEFISILLQLGARVDQKSCDGLSALEVALKNGCEKTVRHLLTWGAEFDQIENLDELADKINDELKALMKTPLGGRRCEVASLGLKEHSQWNGYTGIATKYLPMEDSYKLVLGSTQQEVTIPSSNLRRRDRTPTDCGIQEGGSNAGAPVRFEKSLINDNGTVTRKRRVVKAKRPRKPAVDPYHPVFARGDNTSPAKASLGSPATSSSTTSTPTTASPIATARLTTGSPTTERRPTLTTGSPNASPNLGSPITSNRTRAVFPTTQTSIVTAGSLISTSARPPKQASSTVTITGSSTVRVASMDNKGSASGDVAVSPVLPGGLLLSAILIGLVMVIILYYLQAAWN